MKEAAQQIKALFIEGHSAEDVARMLKMDIDAVVIVFAALQQLVKADMLPKPKSIVDVVAVADSNLPGPPPILKSDDSNKTSEILYKEAQAAAAQTIIRVAKFGIDDASAVRAAIYINEEATGRNKEKAKKSNSNNLILVGQAILQLENARKRVQEALEIPTVMENMGVD